MTRREIFPTTHPSLVGRMLDRDTAIRDHAWSEFIRRYEEPLSFCLQARVRGTPLAAEVDDLIWDFLGYLFDGRTTRRADDRGPAAEPHSPLDSWDRDRGSMRAFVQGVLHNFLRSWQRTTRRHVGVDLTDPDAAGAREVDAGVEIDRRWAFRTFTLALQRLGAKHPERANVWLELQGLSWLVVDRATWTVQSYADATADRPIESAPCSADELAQRLGLATGTIHNRKLDANRFLLTYLVAETKRYHAPDQVRTALLDTLRLLIPLVPELGTLVRQIADRGNDSASGSSSTE